MDSEHPPETSPQETKSSLPQQQQQVPNDRGCNRSRVILELEDHHHHHDDNNNNNNNDSIDPNTEENTHHHRHHHNIHDRYHQHQHHQHYPPATSDQPPPVSNEQLLGVAFLTFFTFATVQMVFAVQIVHSQAMMGDSAAMLVDALTYLFNFVAERQKTVVAAWNPVEWNDDDDDDEAGPDYHHHQKNGNKNNNKNNNIDNDINDTDGNDDAIMNHGVHRYQLPKNNTTTAAEASPPRPTRHDRKKVLQWEIVPPLISVTTLVMVTIFVVRKAVRILILDLHRPKAQQTIPNLQLMLTFSCFNLVLDFVNVMCFARAKHCCGYSTTPTTTTTALTTTTVSDNVAGSSSSSSSSRNEHRHQHYHFPYENPHHDDDRHRRSLYDNNSYEEGDDASSAHSRTCLLDDNTNNATQHKIVSPRPFQPQPHNHQQARPPPTTTTLANFPPQTILRGYSHVPTTMMTTQSSNDKEEYNGTTTIQPRTDATTLPRDTTAVDDNNNELVAIHNIDDIDENDLADDIIEEDYDRYIELIQHHHGEGRPAPTASAAMAAHFQQQSSERHNNNNNHTDYFMDHQHNHNNSNNNRGSLDLEDTTIRDDHEATNLNMCSAYTHVFADTLRSIAVIIAAIIAEVVPSITPEVADSTAAILVSILILLSLYPLVQGLISSCQELHAIYKEEQIESATSSLVTMHSSTEPADHFEMT